MPATKTATKCPCGCGQAPATSCRLRKIGCPCGFVARISREAIGRGMPTCACGERLAPACMEDCAWLPGDEGEHYARLIGGMDSMFDLRSERARKAILRRRRCKLDSCGALVGKGELYCKNHASEGMPF
jgi:hypothetical protein